MLAHLALDPALVEARITSLHQHRIRAREVVMKRKIIGYEKDDEGHWRAELECRHYQHVRHSPPLIMREWVLTAEGRISRLGLELNCKRCDEETYDTES
jgi:hypothetical protein